MTERAMCLLHSDFHEMGRDCWTTAAAWHDQRPDVDDTAARAGYQAAVEQRMLDHHLEENPLPTDPTTCPTPGCTSPKQARQYLCRGCWFTLKPTARRALNRHDAMAVRRLAQLREQLRSGVPLHQIEVAA